MTATVFDVLLAGGLLWLAWQILGARNTFQAVAGFIAFGFLMALAWARLDAPDVALAEAAIGGGLMGALLLSAASHLGEGTSPSETAQWRHLGHLAPAVVLAILLAWPLAGLDPHSPGLRPEVRAALPDSGARNPVTAVLLNFRGYDTLLEVAVLLLAVVSVWSLDLAKAAAPPAPGPVFLGMMRIQFPLLVLFAGYLLWAGADAPGGAFQAGVVLGSAGILAVLAGFPVPGWFGNRAARLAAGAGLGVFASVASGLIVFGLRLLELRPPWAGPLLLLTEGALGLSVAATMIALFAGAEPESGRSS